MPLKRTARAALETPQARALRAAVIDQMAEMIGRIPAQPKAERERQQAKTSRRVAKTLAKARAKWDAASPEWRRVEGAKILAERRRYDHKATMPADGGRELFAVGMLAERSKAKAAKRPPVEIPAPRQARAVEKPAASATPAAPASEASPEHDEPTKPRRRARAGHAGYIDPRLFDYDEWDD